MESHPECCHRETPRSTRGTHRVVLQLLMCMNRWTHHNCCKVIGWLFPLMLQTLIVLQRVVSRGVTYPCPKIWADVYLVEGTELRSAWLKSAAQHVYKQTEKWKVDFLNKQSDFAGNSWSCSNSWWRNICHAVNIHHSHLHHGVFFTLRPGSSHPPRARPIPAVLGSGWGHAGVQLVCSWSQPHWHTYRWACKKVNYWKIIVWLVNADWWHNFMIQDSV